MGRTAVICAVLAVWFAVSSMVLIGELEIQNLYEAYAIIKSEVTSMLKQFYPPDTCSQLNKWGNEGRIQPR